MEIKNRFNGNVIAVGDDVKSVCVGNKANLYGANLRGANLYEADLRGANLYGADLYGAKYGSDDEMLIKYLSIGPIGSRNDNLQVFITNKQVVIKTGCFSGNIEEFKAAVNKHHDSNEHAKHYNLAIAMIEGFIN